MAGRPPVAADSRCSVWAADDELISIAISDETRTFRFFGSRLTFHRAFSTARSLVLSVNPRQRSSEARSMFLPRLGSARACRRTPLLHAARATRAIPRRRRAAARARRSRSRTRRGRAQRGGDAATMRGAPHSRTGARKHASLAERARGGMACLTPALARRAATREASRGAAQQRWRLYARPAWGGGGAGACLSEAKGAERRNPRRRGA